MDDTFTPANDKRFFIRMDVDTEAYFKLPGQDSRHLCTCRDLSAAGMLLTTDMAVSEGIEIDVLVPSNVMGFDDLKATAEVVRCHKDSDGSFKVGIKILTTE